MNKRKSFSSETVQDSDKHKFTLLQHIKLTRALLLDNFAGQLNPQMRDEQINFEEADPVVTIQSDINTGEVCSVQANGRVQKVEPLNFLVASKIEQALRADTEEKNRQYLPDYSKVTFSRDTDQILVRNEHGKQVPQKPLTLEWRTRHSEK